MYYDDSVVQLKLKGMFLYSFCIFFDFLRLIKQIWCVQKKKKKSQDNYFYIVKA
jgi:hypothetical protein